VRAQCALPLPHLRRSSPSVKRSSKAATPFTSIQPNARQNMK